MDRHALVRGGLLTSDRVRLSHSCCGVGRDSSRLRDLQLHFVRLLLQQSPNGLEVRAQRGSTIIGGVLSCFAFVWFCSIRMRIVGRSEIRTQSPDTNITTEAALIAMLRKAKPWQKFAQVRSLSQTTLDLSRRAISRKNSHLTEAELQKLFVRYQYGAELADRFDQYMKNRSNEES